MFFTSRGFFGLARFKKVKHNPKIRSLGTTPFQEKRSRSEKAILGALGAFRGILGATLGMKNSILRIRNSILGMASHDLSNTKTTILGATHGAIPGTDGNPHERFSFAPPFSQKNPRVRKICVRNSGAGKWLRQFYGRLGKCARSAGKAMCPQNSSF